MKPARDSGPGLIVLAISGGLALNYPLLSLFDREASVFGIPLQFMHLFVVWALLIAGIAVLIERHTAGKSVDGSAGTSKTEQRPRPDH